MGNITGNQDRGRFISYAGGDLKFGEDAKAAGWSREIGVGDTVGYRKLQMMMAFIMTIPGVPVIYYGDEFGMPGGNDPDCRRMMKFGNELNSFEQKNLKVTQQLTELRRNKMALLYGDFCYRKADDHTMVFARTYFGQTVIVTFNNSDKPSVLKINIDEFASGKKFAANFGHKVTQSKNEIQCTLPAWSFEILTNQ